MSDRLTVRMGVLLASIQLAAVAAMWPVYAHVGMSIDWTTGRNVALVVLGCLLAVAYFTWEPGPPSDAFLRDVPLVIALILSSILIGPPAQYGLIALGHPLADPFLARADALLGIDVRALTAWASQRPMLAYILQLAYKSFLAQLFLTPIVIGGLLRNRLRLWEFAWHFHFCSVVTVAALFWFPARGAFQYLNFAPLLELGHFTAQFAAAHTGTIRVLNLHDLDGLISFPSFHTAGGLMLIWAVRDYRWLTVVVWPLNALLIVATVLLGMHYAVDVLATGALWAVSLLGWRAVQRYALAPTEWPRQQLATAAPLGIR